VEYRTVAPEELRDFVHATSRAFGLPVPEDDHMAIDLETLEPDRCFAAIDAGVIVGTTGTYSLRTRVPGGGVLPTAGITAVGVQPTHRRRGILTELMRLALAQASERGEPISTLFASEGAIYGRFGYGIASWQWGLDIDATRGGFRRYEPHGQARLVSSADAVATFTDIYTRATQDRPGAEAITSDAMRWVVREHDPDKPKDFYVVHEDDDGRPDAAAIYRVKHRWRYDLPSVEARARQVWATTPQAWADIWRYLLDIDLVARVRTGPRAADDPIRWLLRESRATRPTVTDGLYLRVLDVPPALAARTYRVDGRLVLDLRDPAGRVPAGSYELVVEGGTASVSPTDAHADLTGDVVALGAVYLGGVSWRELAGGGLVHERRDGAIDTADAMFLGTVPPWAPLPF